MARCNCTARCSCFIEGSESDCIDIVVEGAGTSIAPYIISAELVLDPGYDNILSCGEAGLLAVAPDQEPTFIEALDSDCIDITVTGTGTEVDPYIISAEPIIDPDISNILECGEDGLLVTDPGGGEITVRKNSGADVGTRPRLNFIEGSNITLTVTDDAGDNEIDITIAASGSGSADETLHWMGIGL